MNFQIFSSIITFFSSLFKNTYFSVSLFTPNQISVLPIYIIWFFDLFTFLTFLAFLLLFDSFTRIYTFSALFYVQIISILPYIVFITL